MNTNHLHFIEKSLDTLDLEYSKFEKIELSIMIAPESPLSSGFRKSIEIILKSLSLLMEIDADELYWWVFDNDFGRNRLSCDSGGEMKPITNFSEFVDSCGI